MYRLQALHIEQTQGAFKLMHGPVHPCLWIRISREHREETMNYILQLGTF